MSNNNSQQNAAAASQNCNERVSSITMENEEDLHGKSTKKVIFGIRFSSCYCKTLYIIRNKKITISPFRISYF
jgi:hypothetical protein